ncbi:MAG: tetratricopeptide repeat protein [bacterium]
MKDLNEEIEFLVERVTSQSDSILFARLADIYLKMSRVEEAIQLCEDGIRKHPYYVTGHLVLGKSYLAQKMYDQAEKEFKRVLLFDPKCLAAHKLYGDLMQEIGWENTCEMSYKKILEIDPLDEVARSRVGEYILQGENEQTDQDYLAPRSVTSDIDVQSMSPVSQSKQEEDSLFQTDEPDEQIPSKFPRPGRDVDENKEEVFSSILDDIFKDEVVQEDPSSQILEETSPPDDDLVSEIQKDPESYFPKLDSDEPAHEEAEPLETPAFDDFKPTFEVTPSTPTQPNRFQFSSEQTYKETPVHTPKIKKSKSDKIVTPTLGEIYAAQGQYAKAIDVFELLLRKNPENESFAQKIEVLKQKLAELKNAPKS